MARAIDRHRLSWRLVLAQLRVSERLSGLVACGLVAGGLVGLADGALGLAAGTPTVVAITTTLVAGLGLTLGVLVALADAAGRALVRTVGRLGVPPWLSVGSLAAVAAAIASHPLAAALLSGRAARLHPLRGAALVAIPVVAAIVAFSVAQGGRVLARSCDGCKGRLPVLVSALALAAASLVLQLADRRILVRRYDVLHAGLQLLSLLAAYGAVVLGAAGTSRVRLAWQRRRWRALGAAAAAAATVAGVLVAGATRAPERGHVRAALFEQTRFGARVMDAVRLAWPDDDEPAFAGPAVRPLPLVPRVPTAPSPAGPPFGGADVLLITVDALRADHLGFAGYRRATSPALDRLAAESAVFERAYAPAPHTSFSLTSLLTGRHALSLARVGKLDGLPTLADAFAAADYRTLALFPPAIFFSDGNKFTSYEARRFGFEITRYENLPQTSEARLRTDDAIALMQAHHEEPVFMWVHYFAPHEPYVHHPELGPPAPFGERDVDRYDEEVLWVDRELGRLLDHVRAERPGAIVIVSADHGEEFGEHGGAYHGTTLYDEQLRVPLLIHLPGVPARRIAGAVSTVDVAATLTALVGLPWATAREGKDLSRWVLGGDARLPETALRPVFAENDQRRLVALGGHKLVCDVERDFCRLHDTASDPGERRDLSGQRWREAANLRAELAAWLRRPVDSPAVRPVPALLGPVQRDVLLAGAARGDRRSVARVGLLLRPTGRGGALAPVEDRREAARLLARLATPRHRARLHKARSSDPDPEVRAWCEVALAGLGDRRALGALEAEPAARDPALAAYRALALAAARKRGAADALVEVAGAVDDMTLRCRVLRALAGARDERAFKTIQRAYAEVRTRRCAATALGELRTPAALDFLVARLDDEPYTTVRVEVARALGLAGARESIPTLTKAFHSDREEQVVAAAARALADLGAALPVRGGRRVQTPSHAKELWVVAPRATGAPLRVTLIAPNKRLLAARIDTAVSRDAYPLTLPARPGTHVRVAAPGRFALFR
jgi:arylsulfatase A-like enzyme